LMDSRKHRQVVSPFGFEGLSGALAGMRSYLAAWRPLLLLLLAVLVFWPAARHLERRVWDLVDYSHGLLITVISVVLIVAAARDLRAAVQVDRGALPLLCLTLCVGLAGRFAYIDVVQQIAIVLSTWFACAVAFGWHGARRLAFPLGLLLFATQAWDAVGPLLQSLTTMAVGSALHASGVPALIEGNFVHVPAGTFEIERGCAGQGFFSVGLAGAGLYAYLHRLRLGTTVIAIVAAIALALLTNWIRVYVIVWRGHVTDMQTSLIEDHFALGWYLFAGAVVVFLALMTPLTPASPRVVRSSDKPFESTRAFPLAVLVLALTALYGAVRSPERELSHVALRAPGVTAPWSGPDAPTARWHTAFDRPDGETYAAYSSPAGSVELYIGAYLHQQSDRKLTGVRSSVLADGWTPGRSPKLSDSMDRLAGTIVVAPDGSSWFVRHWYRVGPRRVASPMEARLLMTFQAFSPRQAAAVIALAAECTNGCEAAAGLVDEFADRVDRLIELPNP
jgi:EpsI family protein